MKKAVLLFFVMITQITIAQNSKNVGQFNSVNVYDHISVNLIFDQSSSNTLEIKGSGADNVQVINKNGVLKIKMNLVNSFQGDDIQVDLHYNNLTQISVGEGATIKNSEPLKSTFLDIHSKTGGTIKLAIDTEKLNIKAGAGAIVRLTGFAKIQDIVSNSGANVDNAKLLTEQTTVTVNAGGIATVNATEIVDAKTRAGGNITIHGNPTTINEKVVAGGNIKKVK